MFPVTKSHNNGWFVVITSSRERVARFHGVTVQLYPLGQEERGHLFLCGVSHARRWLTSRTGPCHRAGVRTGLDSQLNILKSIKVRNTIRYNINLLNELNVLRPNLVKFVKV